MGLYASKFQPLKRSQNEADFVAEWQFYVIKIQTELQQFELNFAMKKVVSVFADYEILVLDTKQLPTSFNDVLTIITDTKLYNSKREFNLKLLWIAMYGIFRSSSDIWLIYAANKWDRDKNTRYIDVYKERKSTGFVHQNMLQKYSTLI